MARGLERLNGYPGVQELVRKQLEEAARRIDDFNRRGGAGQRFLEPGAPVSLSSNTVEG